MNNTTLHSSDKKVNPSDVLRGTLNKKKDELAYCPMCEFMHENNTWCQATTNLFGY
jgi:hypothetical protein